MTETVTILASLAPVFLVMALGYAAGRTREFDNRHIDSLNALVMDFALPAGTSSLLMHPHPQPPQWDLKYPARGWHPPSAD
jgi:predicted permease